MSGPASANLHTSPPPLETTDEMLRRYDAAVTEQRQRLGASFDHEHFERQKPEYFRLCRLEFGWPVWDVERGRWMLPEPEAVTHPDNPVFARNAEADFSEMVERVLAMSDRRGEPLTPTARRIVESLGVQGSLSIAFDRALREFADQLDYFTTPF